MGLSYDGSEELLPLEGGTYKVYYCYEEAMVWDSTTGKCDVPAGSVAYKTCEVAAPTFVADNDNNEATYTLDYANANGMIAVSPSFDAGCLWQNDVMADGQIDTAEIGDLSAKYFTYDGQNWYELPEGAEIVVTNSDPTNKTANYFYGYGCYEVYDLKVTFKDLSVGTVQLGEGDSVLTVDGNVVINNLKNYGNITVKGKGIAEKDVYTVNTSNVQLGYGFYNPYNENYGGNYTINGVDEVYFGTASTETAVYAKNKIDFSNNGKLEVVAASKGLYTDGDVVIDGGTTISIKADYCITGKNVYISDVADTIKIDTRHTGIYAKEDIVISGVVGENNSLTTKLKIGRAHV